MAKPLIVSVLFVVVFLAGPASLFANDDTSGYPCYTIRESKRRGCFVCAVTFTPNEVKWKGKPIVIGQAWVERRIQRVGWFLPVYKTLPGYHLCFNLSRGYDVLSAYPDNPSFHLENVDRGFEQIGTVVLCEDLENLNNHELTVYCTDNFDNKGAVKIKAVLGLPGAKSGASPR